jgi:hypothetical protein
VLARGEGIGAETTGIEGAGGSGAVEATIARMSRLFGVEWEQVAGSSCVSFSSL